MQYRYKIENNKSQFCSLLTDIINIGLIQIPEDEMDDLINFRQIHISGGVKRINFYFLETDLEYYRYG